MSIKILKLQLIFTNRQISLHLCFFSQTIPISSSLHLIFKKYVSSPSFSKFAYLLWFDLKKKKSHLSTSHLENIIKSKNNAWVIISAFLKIFIGIIWVKFIYILEPRAEKWIKIMCTLIKHIRLKVHIYSQTT